MLIPSELHMSAVKHGFFRAGFMLCDRCILNTRCERFKPGGECVLERKAYRWTVKELMAQYGLEGLADEILASRVAMYLIRIARAENYESAVGVTDKSVLWGRYISRLDNTLRGLMNDLAVTRVKRKQLDKEERVLVSIDELLETFARRSKVKRRKLIRSQKRRITVTPITLLLEDWREEKANLRRIIHGGKKGEHGPGDSEEGG